MTITVTRQLIADIKALLRKRQPPPFESVLKYDRNQPRGPKGSPTGGRWVRGVSAGAGTEPSGSINYSAAPGMEKTRGQAGYADIMNAPTGEGFRNRPRGVGIPEPPEPPKGTEKDKLVEVLKEGSVKDTEPLGGGSNASVIAIMEYSTHENPDGTKSVFKPEAGEQWEGSFTNSDITDYVTNRDFSLAEREAFAFEAGDQLFGADNPVPVTVLRESVPDVDIDSLISGDDDGGGGYDSDELREMYEKYEEKARDQAYEAVGDEMEQLYQDAKAGHAEGIKDRAEELNEIWNEEIENFPDNPAGTGSALAEHPVLPLGSQGPFERKEDQGALDPIEVMDEAGVDYEYALNTTEKNKIREIIRKRLEEGYSELNDVDEDVAKEHLDRDKFIEDHADTENRLMDSKIQGFESWRRSQGYGSGGGGGGGGARNPDAPHPNGGSLQQYVEMDYSGTTSREDGVRMAVLDYVIGSMDRHGSNLGWKDDRPIAIDNGYSMPGSDEPDSFQFRSVAVSEWLGSSNTYVPPQLRTEISERLDGMQALADRHPNMSREEKAAFLGRVENMREALKTERGLYELWRSQQLMRH